MTVKEKKEKIVVAMSGGVDSSVAAGIMKERGFDAIGVSLQLWNYSNSDNRFGTCCSLDDLADARRVAERIGIVPAPLMSDVDEAIRLHLAL